MKLIRTGKLLVSLLFVLIARNSFSQAPVADFTVNVHSGCAPLINVSFNSTSTNNPTSYTWDFGDGSSITNNNSSVQHNYDTSGVYYVSLIATNGSGSSAPKLDTITVFKNPKAKYSHTPDTACSGSPINFTDISTPGNSPIKLYSWSFQDGSQPDTGAGLSNVSHSYINNDSVIVEYKTLLLVSDFNGCSSSYDSLKVYILPKAVPNFGIGSASSCSVPASIDFTNLSSGPPIFLWNFGDLSSGANDTSTLRTPTHIYNVSGSYLVTLISGYPGCLAQDTMTITVAPPIAEFSVSDSIACRRDTVFFTNLSTPTPLSSMTYSWLFGDLSPSSNAVNPKHVYNNPGSYTIKLTTRLGSCTSVKTHSIIVPPSPSINFSSPDHAACDVPFDVTFNADTISSNVGWLWDFGDPGSGGSNTSTLRDPVHTYSNFGTFSVRLTVTDIFGCSDSATLFNYVLVQKPLIDFTQQDSGCVGSTFNYSASVSSPADPVIVSYSWDFGDGSPVVTSPNPDTSHQFNTVGIFDIKLTVTTQSGCTAVLTKQGYARVGTKPDAKIDSVLSTICFDGNVGFNDLTPAPVTGWLWQFGDSQSSTEQNPNHQYKYDTSGVAEPFDIILIAYYNGCADSDTVVNMVTVLPPIPLFDTTFNCLNPDSVNFINLSGGYDSLFWDFGDGSPIDSVSTNPYHIYAGRGDYQVTLTAKNSTNGCIVDTIIIVPVRHILAVASSDRREDCHPATILFSGLLSQDAAAYLWTFGEGIAGVRDTSIEMDTSHIYTRAGYYTATLITSDIHSCTSIDTERVHIIGPTANFTADTLGGCAPINVTFTDNSLTEGSAIVSWLWDYGTGEPVEFTNTGTVTHAYNNTGNYSVKLTVVDANGCTDTHTNINFINPSKPIASIFLADTFGCRNTAELFTGSAGPINSFALPVTYTWDFGDTQTASDTSNTVNHLYGANGSYNIRLSIQDANGCRDTAYSNMFVNTTPAHFTLSRTDTCVEIGGIVKALINANYHSDSNNFVTNWHWDLGVIDKPIWGSPDFFYAYNVPAGSYDASLTVTNSFGCNDTYTIVGAIVVPGPTGSFTFSPDSGCSPLTVDFDGNVLSGATNGQLFAWDFGDGTVLNGTIDSTIQHVYTAVNTYIPKFFIGFQLSTSFCYIPVPTAGSIEVTSQISVNIVETKIYIPEGQSDTLTVNVTNGPPQITYQWNPAGYVTNGPTSNTFFASIDKDSAYYYVTVPYGSTGCSNFDSVLVVFIGDTCEDNFNVDSIPNVFTPDGNTLNDTYYIKNLCAYDNFNIKIFNRWGKIIYESTDPHFQWDGTTTSGTEVSEGVYYYIINGKTKQLHGYVELIRNRK